MSRQKHRLQDRTRRRHAPATALRWLAIAGSGIVRALPGLALALATPVQADEAARPPSLIDLMKSMHDEQVYADARRRDPPPPFKPVTGDASAPSIPLVTGLTLVAARAEPTGDWERFITLADLGAKTVTYRYSASEQTPTGTAAGGTRALSGTAANHTARNCTLQFDLADLAAARSSAIYVCKDPVEHHPGMLIEGPSSAVLTGLRAGQSVEYFFPAPPGAAQSETARRILLGSAAKPLFVTHAGVLQRPCTLTRLGSSDVAVPVLVNDQPVLLPAIKAESRCANARNDGEDYHYAWYVLDQPGHPIWLVQELPDGSARPMQVVKIAFPHSVAGGSKIEQALAKMHPAQVYGIYFDFNSDVLRPDSDTTLADIATVMGRNPGWKLSVGGHTDQVGDDAVNLSLSERRAAAVKAALIARYHVDSARLVTKGYGASRPIDTNTTLEGRARNRRVELLRL